MVSRKSNIEIPNTIIKEINPNTSEEKKPISTIVTKQNSMIPTSSQVAPGSPTTGNSGIISDTRTANNKGMIAVTKTTPRATTVPKRTIVVKTPSRKRKTNVTSSKTKQQPSTTGTLRVSEKRRMVTSLSRLLLKEEPKLTRMLRYFVEKNLLIDPTKQNLKSDINIESNKGKLGASVYFNITTEQRKGLDFNTMYKEINNLNKELNVSLPFNLEKDNFIWAVTIYKPTKTTSRRKK